MGVSWCCCGNTGRLKVRSSYVVGFVTWALTRLPWALSTVDTRSAGLQVWAVTGHTLLTGNGFEESDIKESQHLRF